mgnify:CR=1 FL=1
MIGTFCLWFGWYGFNCGSALLLPNAAASGVVAARVAANTTLSAASGAVSAMLMRMYFEYDKNNTIIFDLTSTLNGTLAGLVAITAG